MDIQAVVLGFFVAIAFALPIASFALFPHLFAPHCAICSEPVTSDESLEPMLGMVEGRLVHQTYVCVHCLSRRKHTPGERK